MANTRRTKAALNGAANGSAGDGAIEGVIADAQATIEGAAKRKDMITFMDEEYRIAEKTGIMPLLKYAHAASRGVRSEDMEGMAAMYSMIKDCIWQGTPACGECAECAANPLTPSACPDYIAGDWERFEQAAIDKHAGPDELFGVVGEVLEMVAARPTQPPSGSSAPGRRTSPKSRRSSSPAAAAGLVPVRDLAR